MQESNEPSSESAVGPLSAPGTQALAEVRTEVPQVPADINVEPDKILDVAAIIDEQAGALQEKLAGHLGALRIQPPADDIVSTNAVSAWDEVVAGGQGSYERRVREYVDGLRALAEQLRQASETYGISEEEKAESFGDRRGHHV